MPWAQEHQHPPDRARFSEHRPPAYRTRRRKAVAARRFPRPSLHGRRAGPFPAYPAGYCSSASARASITARGRPPSAKACRTRPQSESSLHARKHVFPSGIAAANLLGFTTQTAGRGEVATSALSLPRKLIGAETVIHTRRPEAWADLSDAGCRALLDFLRQRGKTSELSPEETVRKTPRPCFQRKAASSACSRLLIREPPRVRAMLGAIGEAARQSSRPLAQAARCP